MLHHKVDQMIAAQQGQPEDSARRLGQQTAAPKRWPKCVAQDLPQRSGQQSRARWGDSSRHSWEINPGTFSQICFPAVGRLIPAHFPNNQNAAQDLPPRSCQQLLHQKGGEEMLHKISSQSWRGNVAQQIGQYDRDTKRFATRCCTRFGPAIAAPKRWPRDAAQDLLQRSSEQCCPQIWQDDRCTRRLATRCCTRFGPEIWPATAAPKLVSSSSPPPLLFSSSLPPLPSSSSSHPPHLLVAKRCCTRFAPEI